MLDFALNSDVQTLCQDPVMREFPVCSERNFATGSDYFSSREVNPVQPLIICDLCFGGCLLVSTSAATICDTTDTTQIALVVEQNTNSVSDF